MQLEALETVMTQQRSLYERLLEIEGKKTASLSQRNPESIELFVREQEELVNQIDLLESKRMFIARNICKALSLDEEKSGVRDIAKHLDEKHSSSLLKCADDLKHSISSLALASETNKKMINDNLEIFRILMDGIRDFRSEGIGYPGMKNTGATKSAMIINRTA